MNIIGYSLSLATLYIANKRCKALEGSKFPRKKIMLFDMDGTLTAPVQAITYDAKEMVLRCIAQGFDVAIATASTYNDVVNQLGDDFVDVFRYIFSANGTVVHERREMIQSLQILDVIPNETLKELVEFCLIYVANLDIPVKRGTFIEHRSSTVNISPIGRNCSQKEREEFVVLDEKLGLRKKLMKVLNERYNNTEYPLSFCIGGQISIDAFPSEWNKTMILKHLKEYDDIYFFGDRTEEGGVDHELCFHPAVVGVPVANYKDLIKKVEKILLEE